MQEVLKNVETKRDMYIPKGGKRKKRRGGGNEKAEGGHPFMWTMVKSKSTNLDTTKKKKKKKRGVDGGRGDSKSKIVVTETFWLPSYVVEG